jgi:hypothetical protein
VREGDTAGVEGLAGRSRQRAATAGSTQQKTPRGVS